MKNVIRTLALMVALAAPASSAFAGTVVVRHHVAPPVHRVVTTSTVHVAPAVRVVTPTVRVGVAFDPWAPATVPVARPGYVWVAGYYGAYNTWYPGYYRPV